MKFEKALVIAERMKTELSKFCKRAEIAGSIRREKDECGDIEIVAIRDHQKLFDLCAWLKGKKIIKGKPHGKYMQIELDDGIKLDLFFADEKNWGSIFLIRTGSANFSHEVAKEWVRQGYKSEGGVLEKDGERFFFREEIDLFNFLGIDYVEPKFRF